MVIVCLFVGLSRSVSVKAVTSLWGAEDDEIERRKREELGERSVCTLYSSLFIFSYAFFFCQVPLHWLFPN